MKESWQLDATFRQEFLDFCQLAATNDEAFANFRQNDRVKTIIENSTFQQMEKTFFQFPMGLVWNFGKASTSDKIGSPDVYDVVAGDGRVVISPTTIRYVYTWATIWELFIVAVGGDMPETIIEIGGGYGGQCKIIHDVYTPESYTIYDLPEVQALQKRFLKEFNISPTLANGIEKPAPYDLLLSWCAWSELDLPTRIEYAEKVISKAKRGMICSNYNLYEDIGILQSVGINVKRYDDEIVNNVLYWEK